MKPFDEMEFHPTSEKVVKILCEKTQNPNPLFFRVLVAYYWATLAAMQRVAVNTLDRGEVPINLYALNLGTSGSGKGYSTNIMENEVIHRFRDVFMETTFPTLAENNLPKLALKRAARDGTDPDEEQVRVEKEFRSLGSLVFSFDSGTSPAVKQLRHKLLMAQAGSINLQIDEIGSNLLANAEVLNTFLELYDMGRIKSKLTKNTSENSRNEEIVGQTPANMLLFGTPSKLFDGAKTEEELYSMLETGYGRRCFYGYSRSSIKAAELTPAQVLDMRTNRDSNEYIEQLAFTLEQLADIVYTNKKLIISKDTTIALIEYQQHCNKLADSLPEHEDIRKAEISHRYFKALKLAGAYAFIDDSPEVTSDHLYNAIKLAEESGVAFNQLLTRDRPYVKLARYVANIGREVTQADLTEDLPFYKGPVSQKQEMLTLATAWGYKNNIIIKKSFSDGIEFLRGESLEATDLNRMVLSYSTDLAANYRNEYGPWDHLYKLTQANGLHWINHHLIAGATGEGHRSEENCIPGFNMVVIDIDDGIPLEEAQELLKGYKYLIYTTKRHQVDDNGDRFRIMLPTNFVLKMDAKEYKEFMNNVYEWLPFEGMDKQTNQRARKWMSHDGTFHYNDGELLDVLPFIPKTSKNEERKKLLNDQQSMDNLERWFMNNTGDGNRNNMLLRYATTLLDRGFNLDQIQEKVFSLNDKMPDKLDQLELMTTIMKTVTKKFSQQP
jgi:hypothetical protein